MKAIKVDELNKLLSGTSVSYDYDNEQLTYLNGESYSYEPVMEALERNGAIINVPDKSDVCIKSLYKHIDIYADIYAAYTKETDPQIVDKLTQTVEKLTLDVINANIQMIKCLKDKGFSEEEIASSVPGVDVGMYFAYLDAEGDREGEEEYEA